MSYDYRPSDVLGDRARKETVKQKRRRFFTQEIDRISHELEERREELYAKRVAEIDNEIHLILAGTHEGFVAEVRALHDEEAEYVNAAALYHAYQVECIEREHAEETRRVAEETELEKQAIKTKMLALLEDKRKRIADERDNLETTGAFDVDGLRSQPTRKATRLKDRAERMATASDRETGTRGEKLGKRKGNRDATPFIDRLLLASETDRDADIATVRRYLGTHVGNTLNNASSRRGAPKRKG